MASKTSSIPLPEAPKESVVARLLIAPITFISFIISLALIDNRNTSFRHHVHAPSHSPTSDGLFGKIKSTLHSWVYRPQPYTYVKSPAVLEREKSGDNLKERVAKKEPWHWNTKQKKMMKIEVADAFEMRKWVVLAMAIAAATFAVGGMWLVRWSYGKIISNKAKAY